MNIYALLYAESSVGSHPGHNGLLLMKDAPHTFSNTFQCISDCKDKINLLNQNKNHYKIYIFYEKERILEQTGANVHLFLHIITCFIPFSVIHAHHLRKKISKKTTLIDTITKQNFTF